MKKTLALFMMIAFVSTLGTAFAASPAAAPDRSCGISNGITWFDLGPADAGRDAGAAVTKEAAAMPYNGITLFGPAMPDPGAQVASAARTPSLVMAKKSAYNGVTVF